MTTVCVLRATGFEEIEGVDAANHLRKTLLISH